MNNHMRERIRWNARGLNDRRGRRIQMWQLAPAWVGEEAGKEEQEEGRPQIIDDERGFISYHQQEAD